MSTRYKLLVGQSHDNQRADVSNLKLNDVHMQHLLHTYPMPACERVIEVDDAHYDIEELQVNR